jgi:hypothetical protein
VASNGEEVKRAALAELARRELAKRQGAQAQSPSVGQKFRHLADQGARMVAEGTMDIVSPWADLAALGLNSALPGKPFPERHSQAFSQNLTQAGLSEPQGGVEKFSNIAGRMVTGAALGGWMDKAVMGGLGFASGTTQPAQTPAQRVLAESQKEGLVVPPAQVAPRSVGATLEGMGGTLKTSQMAAARNQPIINTLAARAVGVTDEALTPEALQAIRSQAGDAYRVIRQAGTVVTDADYLNQVRSAVQSFKTAAQSFESLANAPLVDMAEDLAKPAFEADAAVSAIKMLRDKASVAYRAGSGEEGAAYRAMASAMEDMIERHLSSKGSAGDEVLKAFREARQLIAKTHTVEDAMRGSNVDIHALGRMLKKGVPLTDELRLLGRFSQEFPGAANLTRATQMRPAYSPLDWMTGTASLATAATTGRPELALPAIYAMARPAARGAALSPWIQQGLSRSLSGGSKVPYALGAAPTLAQVLAQQQQQQR